MNERNSEKSEMEGASPSMTVNELIGWAELRGVEQHFGNVWFLETAPA
jgi:hypothetical protein